MRFSKLCDVLDQLARTSKRLEKTALLVELLRTVPEQDMSEVMMLLKGRVYPEWDKIQIGISTKLATRAICLASGEPENRVVQLFKKTGDLGIVAEGLSQKKRQQTLAKHDLTVLDVVKGVRKLAAIGGAGSVDQKLRTIAQLLSNASGMEARFVVRILLEDLRVGVAEGTIRDAIVDWAMQEHHTEDKERWRRAIQDALDCSNDIAKVAVTARRGLKALESVGLTLGIPIKVMLAQKESEIPAAFERVGRPAALEYKYDGFRMQIHRQKDAVTLFTRRLENVTAQFPDVLALVTKEIREPCLLDCEAVGFDPRTGKYTPFQAISQRIRRKYEIQELATQLPVELNVFDILQYKDRSVYLEPYKERRAMLEKVVPVLKRKIKPSVMVVTDSDKKAEEFYKESLRAGNEGIMFKSLQSPYKPGSRVGFMVKLKPILDTLDVVITGAEWGEGKRSGWLTSFTIACLGEDGQYLDLGKVGTGFKELNQEGGASFGDVTRLLKGDILREKGKEVEVRPNVVIEVKFEEIQKSPSYSSGYALRFPRLVRLRDDRRPDEICLLSDIQDTYARQRGRKRLQMSLSK